MVTIDFLKDVRSTLDSSSQQRLIAFVSNTLGLRAHRITLSPFDFYLIATMFGSELSVVETVQIIFENIAYQVQLFVRDPSLPYENKCALITHS